MKIFGTGLSYKTAPVALREQLAVRPSQLRCATCRLKVHGGLSEVVLLSTCNRVEIYGVTDALPENVAPSLFEHLTGRSLDLGAYLYLRQGEEAITHLFTVAGGLDSMVLGETEITGQMKQAYQAAREMKLTGRVLNRIFQRALQTAKEVRTFTSIGRGATSVGSVAVDLAEKVFGSSLPEKAVMIIGAGKMGEACVRHLAKKGVRSVLVSNRSIDRARNLAGEFDGRAIRFDQCVEAMGEADIVVSSTGCPQTILHRPQVEAAMKERRNRPLVLIDIAVPRDIAPEVQRVPNVYLHNIDDLESIVRENTQLRQQELGRCQEIIQLRTAEVVERLKAAPKWVPARPRVRPEPVWPVCQPAV
jgi:glutamyl-tRNA reductase